MSSRTTRTRIRPYPETDRDHVERYVQKCRKLIVTSVQSEMATLSSFGEKLLILHDYNFMITFCMSYPVWYVELHTNLGQKCNTIFKFNLQWCWAYYPGSCACKASIKCLLLYYSPHLTQLKWSYIYIAQVGLEQAFLLFSLHMPVAMVPGPNTIFYLHFMNIFHFVCILSQYRIFLFHTLSFYQFLHWQNYEKFCKYGIICYKCLLFHSTQQE